MDPDFFQKLAQEFPQSAITAFCFIILGSILTNLFGYIKGVIEGKDRRIEVMQNEKLDLILKGQQSLETNFKGLEQGQRIGARSNRSRNKVS
jgi:hypothetical protein